MIPMDWFEWVLVELEEFGASNRLVEFLLASLSISGSNNKGEVLLEYLVCIHNL